MIENNFNTVLDISSIIWDKEDYNSNKSNYYNLTIGVGDFLGKINSENINILLRDNLLKQMIEGFPFDDLPNKFYDFGNIVYLFLGKTGSNYIRYSDSILPNIISRPEQIKDHYNDELKKEIGYLISKIHSDNESVSVYFTFEYLWNSSGQLKTKVGKNTKEYETIVSDKGSALDDFIQTHTPTFEHNIKHNCEAYKTKEAWIKCDTKKNFISQLSCYKEKDENKVQEILNKAIKYKSEYIGYDEDNEVWVRFKKHRDNVNLYHGFDEYDDNIEIIPLFIKSKFNK